MILLNDILVFKQALCTGCHHSFVSGYFGTESSRPVATSVSRYDNLNSVQIPRGLFFLRLSVIEGLLSDFQNFTNTILSHPISDKLEDHADFNSNVNVTHDRVLLGSKVSTK